MCAVEARPRERCLKTQCRPWMWPSRMEPPITLTVSPCPVPSSSTTQMWSSLWAVVLRFVFCTLVHLTCPRAALGSLSVIVPSKTCWCITANWRNGDCQERYCSCTPYPQICPWHCWFVVQDRQSAPIPSIDLCTERAMKEVDVVLLRLLQAICCSDEYPLVLCNASHSGL